jgi:outer membrane lipoprotein LolB
LKRIAFAFIILSCPFFSACTTTKQPSQTVEVSENASAEKKNITAPEVNSWQISGKIAIQNARNSGSASVDWTKRNNNYDIAIVGPIGTGTVKLSGHPGFVSMQTSDGKHYTAKSAEDLLAKQWGYNLPVSNMNYWIRGLPVPNVPSKTKYDGQNRLTNLVQSGWRIQYPSYAKSGKLDLPNKIFIYSSGLTVKIVVYHWKVM